MESFPWAWSRAHGTIPVDSAAQPQNRRPARNRHRRPGTRQGAETRTHMALRLFARGVMRYRDTYSTLRYGPRESGEGR